MSDEWAETTLGEIASWRGGMTPSMKEGKYWNEGSVPWISSKEVVGGRLTSTERLVTEEAVKKTGLRLIPPGSVVVVVRSGILIHTLPIAFVPFATTVNQDVKVAEPSERVLGEFLAFLLQGNAEKFLSIYRKTGTTVQSINFPALLEHPITLPPLVVQRRIVDVLGALDVHLANLKTERETALELVVAAREMLLTPGEDWRACTLGEVLDIARGGSPRPIDDYITNDPDGVNWIKIGDAPVGGKYITEAGQKIRQNGVVRSRRVNAGDFILSNSMSFGRPYILKIDGCIHDGWLVLSGVGKHFDEHYLHALLTSHDVAGQFESLAAGSGVRNLNIRVVSSVQVRIPDIETQHQVGQTLVTLENSAVAIEAEVASLTELRTQVLSTLLSREVEIPTSYDDVLETALEAV